MTRSVAWTIATMAGYGAGGLALHSPGASSAGGPAYEWDVSAAVFGALLGALVGLVTGLLQSAALGRRGAGVLAASVVTVSAAHALADGAPGTWGVVAIAALSGAVAVAAMSVATGQRDLRWLAAAIMAWTMGWIGGVALAGALGLSFSSSPEVWPLEHLVIALCLGLFWGAITSPTALRLFPRGERRAPVAAAE